MRNRQSEKVGKAPGALIFVGKQKVDKPHVEVFQYDKESISQARVTSIEDLKSQKSAITNTWINVTGVHDAGLIGKVGEAFEMHPLQKEAVLNTDQRPRFEPEEDTIFFVIKMIRLVADDIVDENLVETEQVSMLLGKGYLITFQEAEEDVFGPVRERLTNPASNMRNRGPDYLAFALMDTIVDNYIMIIEQFGEEIEDIEEQLLKSPSREHLGVISEYKGELTYLNKNVRPMREVVSRFSKTDSHLLSAHTVRYLKDLEDHIAHAIDSIDTYRDILNDHLNLYNSGMNNRLNDIIRVLTIFSVVFIPLTFVAGVYGTNFVHFPELDYKWAYPTFWIVEIFLATGMLLYFRSKKWL